MKNLLYKSISVMKKAREASNNQISKAEKQDLVACLASTGITHVELPMFTPDNALLVAHGFIPSPKSIEAETQEWFDVIHAQPNVYGTAVFGGYLKVLDRPVFCQTGDDGGQIAGFPIETNTPIGTFAGLTVVTYFDNYERILIGSDYSTDADLGIGNDWSIVNGQLQGPPADGWRRMILTNTTYSDFTATAKVKKVGNQEFVGRATTSSNFPGYGFQIRSDGTQRLQLERPGLEVITSTPKTFIEGAWYWIKMSCIGTAIKGKVWAADDVNFPNSTNGAENEPLTGGNSGNNNGWDIEVTRSDFSSGRVGFSGEDSNGLFDFLTITPTAPNLNSTWVGRYYNYAFNHVTPAKYQTGDILMPFAEMGSLNTTHWTSWPNAATCLVECHKVANALATQRGISLIFTGNVNWDDVNSGAWSGMLDSGISCFDSYGVHLAPSGKPANYVTQYLQNYAGFSDAGYGIPAAGKPMFWGEFGDLAHSIYLSPQNVTSGDNFAVGKTTLEQWEAALITFFKTIRDGLVNTSPQKLVGFNWWGGWEGQNTSILIKTGSGASSHYTLSWRGQILRNFFINDGMGRSPVVSTGSYTEAPPSFGGRQMTF